MGFLKKHSKKLALAIAGVGLIIAGQTDEGFALLQSALGFLGFGG